MENFIIDKLKFLKNVLEKIESFMSKEFLKNLEAEILKLPKDALNFQLESIEKKMKFKKLGVIYSGLRKVSLGNFKPSKNLKNLTLEDLKILEFVWENSEYYEVSAWVLMQVDKFSIEFLSNQKERLKNFQKRIDNWVLSDLASGVFSKILEFEFVKFGEKIFEDKKSFFNILKSWNKSNDPWKIRQSLVSLLFYSRMRKKVLPYKILISFILPHINFSHYYVQKAVGWTIREIYNVYPEECFDFMKNFAKKISSVAWYATTEKLRKEQKDFLMKIRKYDYGNLKVLD
ncbi:MAG: hypothetical protein Fur0024_5400 [Patescibacteria group bacterium]